MAGRLKHAARSQHSYYSNRAMINTFAAMSTRNAQKKKTTKAHKGLLAKLMEKFKHKTTHK